MIELIQSFFGASNFVNSNVTVGVCDLQVPNGTPFRVYFPLPKSPPATLNKKASWFKEPFSVFLSGYLFTIGYKIRRYTLILKLLEYFVTLVSYIIPLNYFRVPQLVITSATEFTEIYGISSHTNHDLKKLP
jgi:hypothetical protein